ncbi:hypothetical protein AAZX31_04G050500 [Glycine max]|uniref:GATA-type domain-containing protein n=2 Tax=Glycine subgen. Soja TaxID=1462606 RepID=K7KI74_SOYBN|nr:putative GATA transcription factor 22 [Glycine max]XP_028226996.1 putative GATA transcription factor 22 [Glycine soja]KAG5065384.1 hypothetical protein JHK86_009115 [Glycine max]KAH1109871.1 hypothetical protein GYH30_008991 [Glycine max]KRH61505.1 hypothetical protein GLYMA_04G051300v4 [Glycine max]RZC15114.1 putative GATA transcription factor 22 [Glycine soja]|eukprot:XP_006578078.1 putative GATA transcription factor 22 [Glycine max]
MTSVSLNPNPPCPTIQDQSQLFISANNHESTSLSCCTFFHILDQSQTKDIRDLRHGHQQDGKLVFHIGPSNNNNQVCNSSSVKLQPKPVKADSSSECGHHNVSLYKIEDEENKRDHDYEKWMSSTARLTRKMMRLPSTSSDLATKKALNNITRVCADCNTTSTPLWRSGPNGPKSLCNACGIRQRKARRAMAEAVNGFAPSVNSSSTKIRVHHKEKKSRTNHFARFRLKCKLATTSTAEGTSQQENVKIDLNDFGLSLRDSSALKQQVFPIMDEVAQAAMLLMDLSCGFVYC